MKIDGDTVTAVTIAIFLWKVSWPLAVITFCLLIWFVGWIGKLGYQLARRGQRTWKDMDEER